MLERPIWLITLWIDKRKGKPADRDVKYVRAATQAGAVRCARFHSMLPRRANAFARLATPQDLGCKPTQAAA